MTIPKPVEQEARSVIIDLTNWVIHTCLMFGSSIETAYKVGAEFAAGLERKMNEENTDDHHPISN